MYLINVVAECGLNEHNFSVNIPVILFKKFQCLPYV